MESAGAAMGAATDVMTAVTVAVAPGDKVRGDGGGRNLHLLPKNMGLSRCSSSSQSRSLAASNLNPSDSAGGSSSHPERKRKRKNGCDEGEGGRKASKEWESVQTKEKESSEPKSRRRSTTNSQGSCGKKHFNNEVEIREEESSRGMVNEDKAARIGQNEDEGEGMGEGEGEGRGRDHPSRKFRDEEGGSCETGSTEERVFVQDGVSEKGKEEPGVVSGGSADSAAIGALQKARRKPGPDRRNGPVTKACIDSRVRECSMCIRLALSLRYIRES